MVPRLNASSTVYAKAEDFIYNCVLKKLEGYPCLNMKVKCLINMLNHDGFDQCSYVAF